MMFTMKGRITLTMVKNASVAAAKERPSFARKWTGKLRVRKPKGPNSLLEALKARYDLK
jgi:hypothetical protein